MLYAQLDKDVWGTALPASWDKAQSMFDYLHKMTWGYQITFETRMIYSPFEPSIKCSLIRWESGGITRDKKRNVLLETTDPEQMESALTMLISEAEEHEKGTYDRRVKGLI